MTTSAKKWLVIIAGLIVIAILVYKNQPQVRVPARPATIAEPKDSFLLSCQSIELYNHFSQESDKSQEFQDNVGPGKICDFLDDFEYDKIASLFHIEKTEPGYSCVRTLNSSQCYWTDASKLHYIGRGRQLSDEEFSQVYRLVAEAGKLQKKAKDYSERIDDLSFDGNGDVRRLDPGQQREVDELNDLYGKAVRQAHDLQEQALKIGH